VSADSVVPGAGNPQAFNRYAYTLNNPLKYIDPSGHCIPYCLPWQSIAPLTVSPPAVATAIGVASIPILAYGTFQLGLWATGDNGPAYDLPDYSGSLIQPSSPLPGTTTLAFDASGAYLMKKGLESAAAHLSFAFGVSGGLPGFPNPFNKHDPDKDNNPKTNGKHIKNALKGFQDNLKGIDLRTYLEQKLSPEQFKSMTEYLDRLVVHQAKFDG
jgi:hypothetical protein